MDSSSSSAHVFKNSFLLFPPGEPLSTSLFDGDTDEGIEELDGLIPLIIDGLELLISEGLLISEELLISDDSK